MSTNQRDALTTVIARDARYPIEAYAFVFEALEHTHKLRSPVGRKGKARGAGKRDVNHVTGQELCEGARHLALEKYGPMSRTILARWNLHATSDLGNVVYNLISAGVMQKTPTDSREDFDNVYDFATTFRADVVTLPEESE
jgi:uncharacterized repeat protein (TIGR04138 family)